MHGTQGTGGGRQREAGGRVGCSSLTASCCGFSPRPWHTLCPCSCLSLGSGAKGASRTWDRLGTLAPPTSSCQEPRPLSDAATQAMAEPIDPVLVSAPPVCGRQVRSHPLPPALSPRVLSCKMGKSMYLSHSEAV